MTVSKVHSHQEKQIDVYHFFLDVFQLFSPDVNGPKVSSASGNGQVFKE